MSIDHLGVYCASAMEAGVTNAKVINPQTIATAPWVLLKCQFGCPHYGRSYCCPPYTPTPEQMERILNSYESAIIFHLEWNAVSENADRLKRFFSVVTKLEKELVMGGYYKAFSMLAGNCRLCEQCSLLKNQPCDFPDQARPSMEACGIDVYQTARNNGFNIQPLQSGAETANIFALILVE